MNHLFTLPSPRPPPIRSSLRKPAQACAWLRKPSDEGRAGRGAAARQPTYFIVADVSRRRPRARMAHATSARRLKTSPCGCANPVLRALASSRLLVRAPIVHLQGATRRAAACCVCSKAVRLHMAHVQLDGSSTLIHRSWLGMCTSSSQHGAHADLSIHGRACGQANRLMARSRAPPRAPRPSRVGGRPRGHVVFFCFACLVRLRGHC